MTATPPNHPLTARITLDAPDNHLMITSSAEPARTLPIQSHADISRSISEEGGGKITVHYVHPYPQLSRQACLWSRTRQFFKQSIEETKRHRAKETLSRRQARWEQDPLAAAGIRCLEWTRIRLILGLNGWGEQLLYRLKSGGLSLYDSTQGMQGCPHSGCVHVRAMTLLHVIWEC
ncbi:hypothetical protein PHMEG_00029173 [Phytophthora megakarya]|uniref:Uncharacterized protein n=1 Tax=Phytophthora megakarya TaxID=4795 RepID=A0A225V2P8_9STRA|nr:hypothetical protein PHMEG_00029173 [Phytophthora megakarya]